jgi:uncharacterized protein (DUF2141 family)
MGASVISRATMRKRRAAAALLLLPLLGAAPVARLDVSVEKLRSAKGVVRLCLTADPGNFPACVDDAFAVKRNVPAGTHEIRFDALPHGAYALAVIHDENANRKLDTLAGIPREGFGFSRNPPMRFGPPRFAAARFEVAGDAAAQQVRMRYIF